MMEDYLLKTGIVSIEQLNNESIKDWDFIFEDAEIREDLRQHASYFLIPFKISLIKFQLNLEYVNDFSGFEIASSMMEYDYVAPSLRILYNNRLNIPVGYPKYFIITFPDVIDWASKGEGLNSVKTVFGKLSHDQLMTNNFIEPMVLFNIVHLYIRLTGKELECKIYNSGE